VEAEGKVPVMMYKSLRCLQNPRKFAVFRLLCSRGKVTTKDAEALTHEPLNYINDTLREFDELKLAKFEGPSTPLTVDGRKFVREGDMEESFKCYSLTEHGLMMHSLCKSYESVKPLADLVGTQEPKRVVESLAKLKKEEVALMLNRFRDFYLLGAVLVSIYYQKHESATSDWLSSCLDGRLSKDEVEKFLDEYTGSDGLVVAESPHRNIFEKGVIRLAESIAGRNRVRKWISNASYSLRPDGRRIAVALSDEFYPSDLGVNEEYLRPEKIEADDGILGRTIGERFVLYGAFLGLTVYVWWDLFHRALSDSLGLGVDLIGVIVTVFGWTLYMPDRVYSLIARVVYWRKLRREAKLKVQLHSSQ
jgi:hypothetical protein